MNELLTLGFVAYLFLRKKKDYPWPEPIAYNTESRSLEIEFGGNTDVYDGFEPIVLVSENRKYSAQLQVSINEQEEHIVTGYIIKGNRVLTYWHYTLYRPE